MNICIKHLAKYSLPDEIGFKKDLPKTLVTYTKLVDDGKMTEEKTRREEWQKNNKKKKM